MPTTGLLSGTGFRRFSLAAAVCAIGLSLAVSEAVAQSKTAKGAVVDKMLRASDGWPIAITYYESAAGQEAPVVILLHRKGGNRLVWKQGFAESLQKDGYAVVAVDLRKHGDSKPANRRGKNVGAVNARDFRSMGADLGAVKRFIFEEHQAKKLNMRRTAIVAPEHSAPIALGYTLMDWSKQPHDDAPTPAARTPRGQDIRALVLLSPVESVPGVNGTQPLTKLRSLPIAFAICYGEGDVVDRGRPAKNMLKVLESVAATKNRVYKQEYKTKARGTAMLGRRLPVDDHIKAFLGKFVKDASGSGIEWRDRRSRLDQ